MNTIFISCFLLTSAACTAATAIPVKDKPATAVASKPAVSPEVEYANKIDNRASAIVKELGLIDEPRAGTVKQILLSQYRSLHDWQETNESRVKALANLSHDKDAAIAAKAKADLEEIMATRKVLRTQFLAALSQQLKPVQITQVKDLMTYNKVQVTFSAYCAQNPWFSEEDKAKVKGWLIEAREEAIDGGSADEKSEIFKRYKGRINNYISKQKPGASKPAAEQSP